MHTFNLLRMCESVSLKSESIRKGLRRYVCFCDCLASKHV